MDAGGRYKRGRRKARVVLGSGDLLEQLLRNIHCVAPGKGVPREAKEVAGPAAHVEEPFAPRRAAHRAEDVPEPRLLGLVEDARVAVVVRHRFVVVHGAVRARDLLLGD